MSENELMIPTAVVAGRILFVRGHRVMIDADLAELYGVGTKVLNQAVKRNSDRFPSEFMFQLDESEKHKVVTNCDHLAKLKYSPVLPYVFTEHGALMLGNVLRSPRAVEISLLVVKTFVRLREALVSNKDLTVKVEALERKLVGHDQAILDLVEAIKQLMSTPSSEGSSIGFMADISDHRG